MKGKHQGIINVEGVILLELNHRPRSREITDTSCQGVHHEVSGEPTPHIQGPISCSPALCPSTRQISPTARDFLAACAWGAGGRANWF